MKPHASCMGLQQVKPAGGGTSVTRGVSGGREPLTMKVSCGGAGGGVAGVVNIFGFKEAYLRTACGRHWEKGQQRGLSVSGW
eukprot:350635-Chlamydomonas_euryale.AAC.2